MGFFLYPEEVEENRFIWCYDIVERVKTGDNKAIKVDIKWDEKFVACGESNKMEEISNFFLCIPSTTRKDVWRQDIREYLRTIY